MTRLEMASYPPRLREKLRGKLRANIIRIDNTAARLYEAIFAIDQTRLPADSLACDAANSFTEVLDSQLRKSEMSSASGIAK